MLSALRILSCINGYLDALAEEISTSCIVLSTLNKVVELPRLSIPIISTLGLSGELSSRLLPRQCISFHAVAGPNFGEVIYPKVSGALKLCDNIILSYISFEKTKFGKNAGLFFWYIKINDLGL